jgi:hypothetical protein
MSLRASVGSTGWVAGESASISRTGSTQAVSLILLVLPLMKPVWPELAVLRQRADERSRNPASDRRRYELIRT